jgi:hypothetical protein
MTTTNPKRDPDLKATKAERERAEELGREAYAAGIIAPAIDKRWMDLLDGEGRIVGQPRTIQIGKAWIAGYTAALLAAPVESENDSPRCGLPGPDGVRCERAEGHGSDSHWGFTSSDEIRNWQSPERGRRASSS